MQWLHRGLQLWQAALCGLDADFLRVPLFTAFAVLSLIA